MSLANHWCDLMAQKLVLTIILKTYNNVLSKVSKNLSKLAASSGGGFESLHSLGICSGMFIYKRLITLNYHLM